MDIRDILQEKDEDSLYLALLVGLASLNALEAKSLDAEACIDELQSSKGIGFSSPEKLANEIKTGNLGIADLFIDTDFPTLFMHPTVRSLRQKAGKVSSVDKSKATTLRNLKRSAEDKYPGRTK